MADIAQAYVQIVPRAKGIGKQIGDLIEPGSGQAGERAGASIGSGIKRAIIAAGIGAAVVGVIKSAIDEGGKLQQAYGGLDTIYGEAAEAAKAYSKEAAQAGISANDYAEQAVSFGASLKQAFSGDTTKAVEAANTAILDMTDNAAKMGTPIQMIQNAYQGFAKQNYTMLDNLKLGYGGTKTEMERLLADAEKISGVHYDISNLGDVYDAIHVIQGDLGLTGTAAKEASDTFTGSMAAMKAYWHNFLGALSMGEDVQEPLNAVIKSAVTFINGNMIPMIVNVVKGLPGAIAMIIQEGLPGLISVIATALPQIVQAIQQGLPMIYEAIFNLFRMVIDGLKNNGASAIQGALNMIMQMVTEFLANYPTFVELFLGLINTVVQVIIDSIPAFIEAATQLIMSLVDYFVTAIPIMLQAGVQLFTALIGALPDIINQILTALPQIIEAIIGMIPVLLPQIIDAGVQLLSALVTNLPQIIDNIISALPSIITAIINSLLNCIPSIIQSGVKLLSALVTDIGSVIHTVLSAILKIVAAIVKKILESIPQIVVAGVKLLVSIVKNLPEIISDIVKAIPKIIKAMINTFKEGISDFAGVGKELVRGLWDGISGAGGWLMDKVTGFCKRIWDKVKNFFDIGSPSKEFAWIGRMLDEGLAGGILAAEKTVFSATDRLGSGVMSAMSGMIGDLQPALAGDFTVNGNADAFWGRADSVSDSIVSGMATVMAGQGHDGNIVIPIYLYPSGPKMGEETVKMYDTYKRQLG